MLKTKIAIFKGKKARKTIYNNQLWFVIEDIVSVLTNSLNPRNYINKMRSRDRKFSKGHG